MIRYVLGFAFDLSRAEVTTSDSDPRVVLIRKNRPEWQAGRLNGIGGHVEPGESMRDAMEREFFEEAGLIVGASHWDLVTTMEGNDWAVEVFRAFGIPVQHATSLTDETVSVLRAHRLPGDVLSNLRWLIPLALDLKPYAPRVWYR